MSHLEAAPAAITRRPFFDAVRGTLFRGGLTQGQVDGCNRILAMHDADPLPDLRWLAYMLATTYHETGRTMQPVEEVGRGAGRPYGRTAYWGRGLVQLTWRENYRRFGTLLGEPLLSDPARACAWEVALPVLRRGMVEGLFTGRRLAEFFDGRRDDPVQARRIINGVDRAALVAEYHREFVEALS